MNHQKELKYNYVKNEIENYNYYLSQIEKIDADLREIGEALDEPRSPGSIIRMGNKSIKIGDTNWINELVAEEQRLFEELEEWQHKVERIDKWLLVLSPSYQKAIRAYVIENKCRDAQSVADKIGYTKRGLLSIVLKSIKKISNIF